MIKLGDIGKILTGNTPKTSETENYNSDDICFVKPSDILGNDISYINDSEFYISETARSKARILPIQSVLVTCIGIIGKVAINQVECAFNQQINAIIPNLKKCLPSYLAYAIQYRKEQMQDIANAAVVPILNKTQFSNIEINLPSLDKQHETITVLCKIGKLISLRKQQLTKLDELVKARFVEMFGNITETVPLSYYISALSAGKSLAGEKECTNKVLKTGAATYDEFDPTQIKNLPTDYIPQADHLLKTGDIIISRMNTLELVGATAYVWEAPQNTYLPDRLWRAEINKNTCPVFVWQLLIQNSSKDEIRKIASGTSGSMKNISKPGLLGICVKKVECEAQKEFSIFVEQTHRQKLTIQQSLDKLEVLKKSLMQEYFG